MSNNDLYQIAVRAVNELFSDTSVSKEVAVENLKNLREEIDTLTICVIIACMYCRR